MVNLLFMHDDELFDGQNGGSYNVHIGDIILDNQFADPPYDRFDDLLANPSFGVDWKKQCKKIEREHGKIGFAGRFGAGTLCVNDGSLLFVQHMISKFEPVRPDEQRHGSRLAVVLSGSPLPRFLQEVTT